MVRVPPVWMWVVDMPFLHILIWVNLNGMGEITRDSLSQMAFGY